VNGERAPTRGSGDELDKRCAREEWRRRRAKGGEKRELQVLSRRKNLWLRILFKSTV
jgi:hypothetical protein